VHRGDSEISRRDAEAQSGAENQKTVSRKGAKAQRRKGAKINTAAEATDEVGFHRMSDFSAGAERVRDLFGG
jgi:hypothetical protein